MFKQDVFDGVTIGALIVVALLNAADIHKLQTKVAALEVEIAKVQCERVIKMFTNKIPKTVRTWVAKNRHLVADNNDGTPNIWVEPDDYGEGYETNAGEFSIWMGLREGFKVSFSGVDDYDAKTSIHAATAKHFLEQAKHIIKGDDDE